MPATRIEFDPYTSPYDQWKVIGDFTTSKPVVVIEYRSSEHTSNLCGRHDTAHYNEYSDIAFGTVHYREARHASAREQVMSADTVAFLVGNTPRHRRSSHFPR